MYFKQQTNRERNVQNHVNKTPLRRSFAAVAAAAVVVNVAESFGDNPAAVATFPPLFNNFPHSRPAPDEYSVTT